MKDYIQALSLSILSGIKEEAGHLEGGKTVTRLGSQSLAVDRPLSPLLRKGKQGEVSSSARKRPDEHRAEKLMGVIPD